MARPQPYDRTADPTRPDGEHAAWETPVGLVAMYAPTALVPYYRITWGNPQEGTSVGRYFDRAWAARERDEQRRDRRSAVRPEGALTKLQQTRVVERRRARAGHRGSVPAFFNSDRGSSSLDNRSDDKGPETEGITLGKVGGRT